MFTFPLLSVILFSSLVHSVYADSVATFAGEGTWYTPQNPPLTGIGACGWAIGNNDPVVALANVSFYNYPGAVQGNPNNNPICGQLIWITYQGKSVVAKVGDECADCPGPYNVDMTQGTFQLIADLNIGRLKNPGITWSFVPSNTPLGAATGSPPPPPPGAPVPAGTQATTAACTPTAVPAPARRSPTFDKRKRSSEQSGGYPPHERKMVKRYATTGKSAAPERRSSIQSRTTSTTTEEEGVSDTARVGVPQPRSHKGHGVSKGQRNPDHQRSVSPSSSERRMIKRRADLPTSADMKEK